MKREIVDQLVDSWAYLEADADQFVDSWAYLEADSEHWQSTDIGGPIEIEEPCWHIFVFDMSHPCDMTITYKCGMCGELKVVDDINLYKYVPAGYNRSKQGPPPHLPYNDGSMRRFGRQLGFAPPESMADTLARIDGLELHRAERIAKHILRD